MESLALRLLDSDRVWRYLPRTFRALRERNFRLLWLGLVVSAVGTWMQVLAQSLLVLRLSNGSALALGEVSLAQAASFFLFSFVGGTVADRVDKRRLLLATQCCAAGLALLLGVLTSTGLVRVWMIVVLAFLAGAVVSFDQPTRAALVPALVPPEDLMNAISLQPAVNGAAVVGPALGGIVISQIGIAGDFYLNALSFLAVLVAVYFIKLPPSARPAAAPSGHSASPLAALTLLARDPVLPWLVVGYGLLLFLGPSPSFMLPIFGTQILNLDPFRLGLLFTATGVGTVVGVLGLASLGDVKRKGVLALGALLLWAAGLALFAVSRSLELSILGLGVYAMAQNGVAATTITLLQTRVPAQMHGRVMGLNTFLIMGIRPLGDFPAGALTTAFGAPPVVLASALFVGVYGLYLLVVHPSVRRA
jgi:MFS family permease